MTNVPGNPRAFAPHPALCKHRWVVGRSPVQQEDCDRPLRVVCGNSCGTSFVKRCGVTSRAKCGPCSESHRRRVARIASHGSDSPGLFMVTLTAPGADQLPWNQEWCEHPAGHPCSGSIGCRVEDLPAAAWNGLAPRAWSDVVTYVRRKSGVDVQYVASWETQKRGVLHRHAIVRAVGISERRFRAAWRLSALRWGFGRQVQCDALSGDRAGYYVAKYASKSVDELGSMTVLNRETGELVEGAKVRPWSSSRKWGLTMKEVKASQAAWAQASALQRPVVGHHAGAGGGAADPAGGGLDLNSDSSTTGQVMAVSVVLSGSAPSVIL
jgi:hypothetical protein